MSAKILTLYKIRFDPWGSLCDGELVYVLGLGIKPNEAGGELFP